MASTGYKMPHITVGMTVLWHDGGRRSNPPAAAIVTAIYPEMVDLSILQPTAYNLQVKQGVRFVGDPNMQAIDHADVGAWDYTPETKLLHELRATVARLTSDNQGQPDRTRKAS